MYLIHDIHEAAVRHGGGPEGLFIALNEMFNPAYGAILAGNGAIEAWEDEDDQKFGNQLFHLAVGVVGTLSFFEGKPGGAPKGAVEGPGPRGAGSTASAAGGPGRHLVRFGKGPESVEALAADAARAEKNGFPHGVSTKLVDRISGSDKAHRSAPFAEVQQHFRVEQTGRNPAHHTVHLPKPVTQDVARKFNAVFKPKE